MIHQTIWCSISRPHYAFDDIFEHTAITLKPSIQTFTLFFRVKICLFRYQHLFRTEICPRLFHIQFMLNLTGKRVKNIEDIKKSFELK